MVTYTTTYNLKKPTVGQDDDQWGGYANDTYDLIDDILDGTVPVTGIDINSGNIGGVTIDGDLSFTDSTKAIFGAGSDLQIYHDTSNSRLNVTSGNLYVNLPDTSEFTVTGTSNTAFRVDVDSAVTLYNNGSPKITTTSTGIDVTGNITVSGTVDGRDVAADGTKLDGIESGATADQTKADIDALGINAATLDSLDSTHFLRSDANDTATGKITLGAANFAEQLEINRSGGNFYSVIKYSNSSGELGKLGFTQNNTLIARLGTSGTDNTIWHSGNDGSGSGLDADTVDGIQATSFLRSDANDTASGVITLSSGSRDTLNFSSTSTEDNRGVSFNGRIALSSDGSDGWLRLNNASEFSNGIYTPSNFRADGWVSVGAGILHVGDSDTSISFGTDTITLATGGSSEITVNSTGVRLGDTGNGYFQPVSGTFGSIQIDGGGHGGYEGYSIGGESVFMSNGSRMGLYDDTNNEWALFYDKNGEVQLYYNGSSKLQTTSSGVNIDGNLNAVDNIYLAGNLYHEGDTDTRLDFATNANNLRAGNQHEVQVTTSGMFLINSALHEDYDALSGTSVTIDPNTGGAWSLTMTGNTTFTFGATANNYSVGLIVQLTGNGGTVTWPTSVDWAGGTAPDAPASGETDIYVFWTRDGGTTWYGVQSIDAAA